jgi:hypothetical protein
MHIPISLYLNSRLYRIVFYFIDGPGLSISFNSTDESITKTQGQSLGPIVCSAQCNPPCQFYWIKPAGSVVDGSNLEIPSLSKNDHGTFTCQAGNGYGNNATKNLQLTVNCKYLVLNAVSYLVNRYVINMHDLFFDKCSNLCCLVHGV